MGGAAAGAGAEPCLRILHVVSAAALPGSLLPKPERSLPAATLTTSPRCRLVRRAAVPATRTSALPAMAAPSMCGAWLFKNGSALNARILLLTRVPAALTTDAWSRAGRRRAAAIWWVDSGSATLTPPARAGRSATASPSASLRSTAYVHLPCCSDASSLRASSFCVLV